GRVRRSLRSLSFRAVSTESWSPSNFFADSASSVTAAIDSLFASAEIVSVSSVMKLLFTQSARLVLMVKSVSLFSASEMNLSASAEEDLLVDVIGDEQEAIRTNASTSVILIASKYTTKHYETICPRRCRENWRSLGAQSSRVLLLCLTLWRNARKKHARRVRP